MPVSPSIQSFSSIQPSFPKPPRPNQHSSSPTPGQSNYSGIATFPGDGFTEEEKAAAHDPLNCVFNPTREYEKYDIGSLQVGSLPVSFCGRVVSVSVVFGKSKSQKAAKGWCGCVVRDDSGAICVRIYFAHHPPTLLLGTLLTIWTPFIATQTSVQKNLSYLLPNINLSTSIFPGRDTSVHMLIHQNINTNDICRVPLGYKKSIPLPGLMTLKSFIEGGHEVENCKVLLCVKSIGREKNITSKKSGQAMQLLEITLMDDTGEIVLTLWRELAASAKVWEAGETILLFSSPILKDELRGRKATLAVGNKTMVDVEPNFQDAEWLGKWAKNLKKRECVKQEIPDDIWDVESAEGGVLRVLFTLADVDDFVRDDPRKVFTGFLSMIIVDLHMVIIRQRNMLMVTECCGIPQYSNTQTLKCPHCDKILSLALNPKIIGTLIDETGSIAPGKLLWTPKAWKELLGRTVEEFMLCSSGEVRDLEQRLLGLRITLVFGWEENVGRLCVLGVKM